MIPKEFIEQLKAERDQATALLVEMLAEFECLRLRHNRMVHQLIAYAAEHIEETGIECKAFDWLEGRKGGES